MGHRRAGPLMTLVLTLMAPAYAAENDYRVSAQPNGGFEVFEITHDGATTVPGGPFGSKLLKYVWTDGSFIYAVNYVPTPGYPNQVNYYSSDVITYKVESNVPRPVAKIIDDELDGGGCGHCSNNILGVYASAQHLFMAMVSETSGAGIRSYVHMYHTHPTGELTFMCDLNVPLNNPYYTTAVTNVHSDAGEIYGYIDYTDPATLVPETLIYDISTKACKLVGTIPRQPAG